MLAPLRLNRSHAEDGTRSRGDSLRTEGGRAALKYYADRGRDLIWDFFDFPNVIRLHPSSIRHAFRKREPVTPIADPCKIIWVRPADIIFKISGDHDLHADDILAGDWDLDRALVVDSIKYQSICKHFQDGVAWEDTELFDFYTDRFRRGEVVRGADSLPRLKRQYETRVDPLFRDLRANGFRIARDLWGRPTNVPHVHIGRGGEILYGTKGNHRLAMAKLLSIRVVPCHVRTRHADWQKIREAILSDVALTVGGAEPSNMYREFMKHPDLADLFFPNQ